MAVNIRTAAQKQTSKKAAPVHESEHPFAVTASSPLHYPTTPSRL